MALLPSADPSYAATLAAALLWCTLWMVAAALLTPPQRPPVHRVALGLLALGAAGFAVAAAHVVSPTFGAAAATGMLLSPPLLLLFRVFRRGASAVRGVGGVVAPLALVTAAAALVLWVGLHPFAWTGETGEAPAKRYSDMPIDNWIPLLFAQALQSGELVRPLVGDWLGSDRPPLQSGLYLLFNGNGWLAPGLAYQAIGTWLQLACLIPLLALLPRRVPAVALTVALLALALSPLIFFNALYVWPKLLAAAFCAIYHLLLFHDDGAGRHGRHARLALAGAAAALALLSHGGAFFGLCGSTLAFIALQRREALRALVTVAPVAMVAYAPWLLYQRFVDPPGNRLVKWHFAGEIGPSDTTTVEALRSAYAAITPAEWFLTRWQNVEQMFARLTRFLHDVAELATGADPEALRNVLTGSFFSLAYSLWLFNPIAIGAFAAFAMWHGWRPGRGDAALAITAFAGIAVWVVLMFEPGSTIVHQGSYFLSAIVLILGMRIVAAVSPIALAALAGGNIALWMMAYVPKRVAAEDGYATGVAVLFATLAVTAYFACRVDRQTAPLGDARDKA